MHRNSNEKHFDEFEGEGDESERTHIEKVRSYESNSIIRAIHETDKDPL